MAGVLIAFIVAAQGAGWLATPEALHFAERDFAWIEGVPATVLGLGLVVAIAAVLVRAARSAAPVDEG